MDRGNRDIVVLNVGGTSFTSSVSTLVSSSSYFERRLSEEWRERDPSGTENIMIDQDPLLFSVLLSYMRLGSIDAEKLTTPVILLAVFLGMDQLLEAVRAVAIRWKFEERNSSLFLAAQAARLVQQDDVRKKFASLTICHPDFISFRESRGVRPDFVVFVNVQNDDGTVEINPNSFTFIDALNFLSKSGYTKYESEKFEPNDQDYGPCLVCMWFSKLVTTSDMEDVEETHYSQYYASESTIIENDRSPPKKFPREYCFMIDNAQNGDELSHMDLSVLEADVGNAAKPVAFEGMMELLDETVNRTTQSVILDQIDSKIKKYNWLQSQGYITSEDDLANAYHRAHRVFNPRGGHHYVVSVWSRPSSESR